MVDDLTSEFEERCKKSNDTFNLERARQWFGEAIKQGTLRLYENVVNMLESAIYHMEEANKKLKKMEGTHNSEYTPSAPGSESQKRSQGFTLSKVSELTDEEHDLY